MSAFPVSSVSLLVKFLFFRDPLFSAVNVHSCFSTKGLEYYTCLKFETVYCTTSCCIKNIALCMANSVDPDQKLHSLASDLGLHSFQRPICPITWGDYGMSLKNSCYSICKQ